MQRHNVASTNVGKSQSVWRDQECWCTSGLVTRGAPGALRQPCMGGACRVDIISMPPGQT